MKKLLPIILLAAVLMSSVSCIDDRKKAPELVSGEVEFLSQHGRWTYISLESGTVVGTSFLGDEDSDAAWALRDEMHRLAETSLTCLLKRQKEVEK